MTGENAASAVDAAQDDGDARQRSTIQFPYNNLADAIEVAQAIHSNVGSGDCDDAQLSAWLNMSPKSSGYRIQISAARMFGLIESVSGRHKLTSSLGRMIVDPQRERSARVQAFQNVPLYKAIFEKYKGGVLPPPAALERDITALGVAEKQTSRARTVFERSAEQAGYFEHGKNRLVMPGVASNNTDMSAPPPPPPSDDEEPERKKNKGGEPPEMDLHPFIQGLLKTLPEPETEWQAPARVKWLQTAANIFDLIYKGDGGGIVVTGARAERSPRPGD
jgi:hypothetical protein